MVENSGPQMLFAAFLTLFCNITFLYIGFLNFFPREVFNLLFILLFFFAYIFAQSKKEEWTLAIYPIFLSLLPENSIVGITFPVLWMLGVIFLEISTIKDENDKEDILRSIKPVVLLIFIVGFFLSMVNTFYGVHSEIGGSVARSIVTFLNIYGILFVGPFFFSLVVDEPKKRIALIILAITIALSFYAIILRFGQPLAFKFTEETGFGAIYVFFGWEISLIRTSLCILLSVCAASAFSMLMKIRSFIASVYLAIIFVANVFIIIWSGARGATISLALTVIIVAVGNRKDIVKKAGQILFVCLAAYILVASFSNIATIIWETRWADLLGSGISNEQRPLMWMDSINQIIREPFGIGWTSSFLEGSQTKSVSAHNDFLALGMSYGAFGGLAYLLIVLNSIWMGFQQTKKSTTHYESILGEVAFAAALCLALNSLTDTISANITRFYLCWFIISIGIAPYLRLKKKDIQNNE